MIRPRLAPRALLTTISLSRVAARASINSETLPQTRTTSITAKRLTHGSAADSDSDSLKIDCAYAMTRGRRCSCVSGNSAAVRPPK